MPTEQLTKCFEPTAEAEDEVGIPLYRFKPPYHSKAVLLMWFPVMLVLVAVSVLLSSIYLDDMSLVVRKPVFEVFDQV